MFNVDQEIIIGDTKAKYFLNIYHQYPAANVFDQA